MQDDSEDPKLVALPSRIPVAVSVDGAEVIASGTVIARPTQQPVIKIADLSYRLAFEDTKKEHAVRLEQSAEKELTIFLVGFSNPLGTSANFLGVGTVMGQPLRLSLYVEAIDSKVKVISYTAYLGGDIG